MGVGSVCVDMEPEELLARLQMLRSLVAQPVPVPLVDPAPALIGEDLLVGSRHHALDVQGLLSAGVSGVLNCAPSGVRLLPCDAYQANGIHYRSTNVRRDDCSYRILHGTDGVCTEHLQTAKAFYDEVKARGGKTLFFCVAGQNRSAVLAVAVLLLSGWQLDEVLGRCASVRPFILENTGFQQQLVELETFVRRTSVSTALSALSVSKGQKRAPSSDESAGEEPPKKSPRGASCVTAELRVPGFFRGFEVKLPREATISSVKAALVKRVNRHLAQESSVRINKSWLVYHDGDAAGQSGEAAVDLDLVLEEEALEADIQLAVLQNVFGLQVCQEATEDAELSVRWKSRCSFELVIFSVLRTGEGLEESPVPEPFTFHNRERVGALGTLLSNNGVDTHLRGWDFGSGAAYRSQDPLVFSFSKNPKYKRDFVEVSSWSGSPPQRSTEAVETGNGSILGMGANAIVHRAELFASTRSMGVSDLAQRRNAFLSRTSSVSDLAQVAESWDAAVKRPFTLGKMLAFLESKSEAGVAKRLRMAGALNKSGRLLYFYGVGVALSSNSDDRSEYKFEAVLLSRYQEEFSTYTLKKFLDDYTSKTGPEDDPGAQNREALRLQQEFSLIKVKVLLVSLLNGFRDLTLMGIQAFDFNHLNNVLISRDYRKARLIDIDGESKGSIQFPSPYMEGRCHDLHMPALDIELSTLLPVVVAQLVLGKGRGPHFATEKISEIKRAQTDADAKQLINAVVRQNFFPGTCETNRHLLKVVEWFHALLLRRPPWNNWTSDIYDAMRCIDHLPIS